MKVLIILSLGCLISCCLGAAVRSDDDEGWILVAHRFVGNLNFFRNWEEFKAGFEDSSGEFFAGLQRLHELTSSAESELKIEMEDFDGEVRYAMYNNFLVGSEDEKYKLKTIGNYSGTAGNSLYYNLGSKFTTYDSDNDSSRDNCAMHQLGGWWYNDCSFANPFGLYLDGAHSTAFAKKSMYWQTWRGNSYSYKVLKMLVRPKN